MGRLRASEDAAFIASFAAEVNELVGTDDCTLYRYMAAWPQNIANKDPLWDEPEGLPYYEEFKMPMMIQDFTNNDAASDFGVESDNEATGFIALEHLKRFNVPLDHSGDYVNIGDVIGIFDRCGHETTYYDVINTNREGRINATDAFTGYSLSLTRKQKYVPERKL